MKTLQQIGLIALSFALPQHSLACSTDVSGFDARNGATMIILARNGADDGGHHDRDDDKGGARDDNRHDGNHHGHQNRGRDTIRQPDRPENDGGRRPRQPGGSGCDSARDMAEHPLCRG